MTVRLPQGLIEHLTEWAAASGVSRSEAVRMMIENGVMRKPVKAKK